MSWQYLPYSHAVTAGCDIVGLSCGNSANFELWCSSAQRPQKKVTSCWSEWHSLLVSHGLNRMGSRQFACHRQDCCCESVVSSCNRLC